MRDDITSIPISEVFEPQDGCPLCRLQALLEERVAVYITGAAMMEPDVRQETNRLGFCHRHYRRILAQHKRLSVALMLESHLAELEKTAFATGITGKAKKVKPAEPSCFICEQLDANMAHCVSNVTHLWEREKDFRTLYAAQPYFCLPHCRMLTAAAAQLPGKLRGEFVQVTADRSRAYLSALEGDITHFCKMFDYHNNTADADWGNSKDAIERTVQFLTAEKID